MSGDSSTISGSLSNNASNIDEIEKSINSSLKSSKSGRSNKSTQLHLTVKLDGKKIPYFSDTEIRKSKSPFSYNDNEMEIYRQSKPPPAIPEFPQDESPPTNSESGRRFQMLLAKRQEDQILLLNSSYLNCPICHETFVEASSLGCGHTFCKKCIVEWTKRKNICPLCGIRFKKETSRAYLIDKIIEDHISNFPQRTKDQIELASRSRQEIYLKRIQDQKNPSIMRRKLNSIQNLKYDWDTKGMNGIFFKFRRVWHNFSLFTSTSSNSIAIPPKSSKNSKSQISISTDEPGNKFSFKSIGFFCLMLFIGFFLGIFYCQFNVIQHFIEYLMDYKPPGEQFCGSHESQSTCRYKDKSRWFDWF